MQKLARKRFYEKILRPRRVFLLAAAQGQILHQRRGALQRLGTLGVAENPGHPGAWAAVDDDRLSHRRVGGGGTEYAVLTEDAI